MKLPQLSLRELFWLVLVCALVVGWWSERTSRLEAETDKAEAEAAKANSESLAEGWRLELQSACRQIQRLKEETLKVAP
jgi:hypothetical protein